jgi:hypothetical protein
MGFLTGSVTFERFRIANDPTNGFGEEHLEALKQHRIGASDVNLHEQASIGFTGGAHLLDTSFDAEKNILGEAMHFGIRIDSCSVPGPIKRAWTQIELAGIMADNLGGRPTKSQREEAKEAVEARCAAEAEKGNFKRMGETSVLWDADSETLFLGGASEKTNDACIDLLERAFGLEVARVSSGKLALEYAEEAGVTADLFAVNPTAFLPGEGAEVTWWNGMTDNYDYLGNEFLMWLWWKWETGPEVIALGDETEVTGMFARTLSLDCPKGEFGKESISSESPVALPEAAMAIRMGKLPRKAGLTLIRNGEQYDVNLQAETFVLGSAKISRPGDNSTEMRDTLDRIESIRCMAETIDLLFEAFCEKRIGKSWIKESKDLSEWLLSENAIRKRRVVAAA